MELLYDLNDLPTAEKLGDPRLIWLQELNALAIQNVAPETEGFLFSYDRGFNHFKQLRKQYPNIVDAPEDQDDLSSLSSLINKINQIQITIPTPKTWTLLIDHALPEDLTYPLFLRTETTSWKRGGKQSQVRNEEELIFEVEELRRHFGWNTLILAREWLKLQTVGTWKYGQVPREVRLWFVNQEPCVWNFHYLDACQDATNFPLSANEISHLNHLSSELIKHFNSRLVAFDFALAENNRWYLIEAAPGACAGIAHKKAFETICQNLRGQQMVPWQEKYAGTL